MNLRRGFFRIWVVTSFIWVIAVGVVTYPDVKREIDIARAQGAETPKNFVILLPVACEEARGIKDKDYERKADSGEREFCWYEMPKFRSLYTEYADLNDKILSERLYRRAGLYREPHIVTELAHSVGIALAAPLLLFATGLTFAWIAVGFRSQGRIK